MLLSYIYQREAYAKICRFFEDIDELVSARNNNNMPHTIVCAVVLPELVIF